MTTDVREKLFQWSRWRQINHGADIGYPRQSTFVRYMKPNPGEWGARSPVIDDEDAERVDGAVSRLKRRCGDGDYRFEVLTDHYLLGRPDAVIARRLKISRSSAINFRKAAENFVDGRLDDIAFNC